MSELRNYCHLCGSPLGEGSRAFRHKKWPRQMYLQVCAACQMSKPRCNHCGLPMAAESVNGACSTCNEAYHLCLACGKVARGKRYYYEGIGPYCARCLKERRPCDLCTAPLTQQSWKLSDGRVFCALCYASAVFTPEEAKEIYEEIKTALNRSLGITLNIPTGLALVDRRQLKIIIQQQLEKMENDSRESSELDAERTLGIYVRRGLRRGIYVQSGLPRMLFLQIAAHEYAHAWQGENCPFALEQLQHEGFAEWVAYHLLEQYNYALQRQRMLQREDIYGRGLRWALDLEQRAGTQAVLDLCRYPASI